MSPRPDVSEERRSQIIQSAIQVFGRKGLAKTRMDDVASESGLSKGLLYWYFKKQRRDHYRHRRPAVQRRVSEFAETVCGKRRRRALAWTTFWTIFLDELESIRKAAPVIYEFYALAFRNATVRGVMRQYLHRFVSLLQPIVQRGMDTGEFGTGDARQATVAIGAMLEGTLLLWAYAPDIVHPEEQFGRTWPCC